MTTSGYLAAVDLGASSGRVMLGRVGPDQLSLESVHRFPNDPVRTPDGLHWNILELYRNMLVGLGKAVTAEPGLASIGIDAWAVDYALLRGDLMINNPFHYRDERTAFGVELVHSIVSPQSLFAANGLQCLPFNTVYQLAVDQASGLLDAADTVLMLPDLLGFWLTGEKVAERTNASTSGLLDVHSGSWNEGLINKLGWPTALFPRLVEAGSRVGGLLGRVAHELGTDRAIDVTAVGSHDTASAVVGVPMLTDDAAYISSGTWSLVGVELDRPVLDSASRDANFTNEGGVDGRTRFLHNVMGLWLLSECIRTWEREAARIDLGALLAQAAQVTSQVAVFDTDDPSLLPPGDMPSRIARLCTDRGEPPPGSPAEFTRSILESLAAAYAQAIDEAQRLSGKTIRTVHIVGGGSQNALLCQLTADRTGRTVCAGPVEATAIGNVLVQARSVGLVSGGLEDLRALVARTSESTSYRPR